MPCLVGWLVGFAFIYIFSISFSETLRCFMGNDIVISFNLGNVVGPNIYIYIIHTACSRGNCVIISIFILGRFIHAVRLGEHLDKGVDTVIIQECFKDVGDKDINELVISLSLDSL